ncbi:hypothetical protein ACEPAH_5505 [Sanghuangporus vaninii]
MFPSFASLDDVKSSPSLHVLDFDKKTNVSPVIAPLLPEHLDNVFETAESAFKNGPLLLYIKAVHLSRALVLLKLAGSVNALKTAAKNGSSKPSLIDRALRSLELALLQGLVLHSEQIKRAKELDSKSAKVVKNELGDKTQSMFYVDLLAANPEH